MRFFFFPITPSESSAHSRSVVDTRLLWTGIFMCFTWLLLTECQLAVELLTCQHQSALLVRNLYWSCQLVIRTQAGGYDRYLWCSLKLKGWGRIQNKNVCLFFVCLFVVLSSNGSLPPSFPSLGVRCSPLLSVNILFPGLNKQWGAKHGRHMISCMGLLSAPKKKKECVVLGTCLKKKKKKRKEKKPKTGWMLLIQKLKSVIHRLWHTAAGLAWGNPGGMRHVGDAEQRRRTGLYRWLCWVCGSWVQHVPPLFLSFWLVHTVKLQRQRCFVLTLV